MYVFGKKKNIEFSIFLGRKMEDIQPIKSFEELQSSDISTFPQANLKFPKPKGCTLTFKRSNDGKISIKKEEKSTAKTLVCHDMKG